MTPSLSIQDLDLQSEEDGLLASNPKPQIFLEWLKNHKILICGGVIGAEIVAGIVIVAVYAGYLYSAPSSEQQDSDTDDNQPLINATEICSQKFSATVAFQNESPYALMTRLFDSHERVICDQWDPNISCSKEIIGNNTTTTATDCGLALIESGEKFILNFKDPAVQVEALYQVIANSSTHQSLGSITMAISPGCGIYPVAQNGVGTVWGYNLTSNFYSLVIYNGTAALPATNEGIHGFINNVGGDLELIPKMQGIFQGNITAFNSGATCVTPDTHQPILCPTVVKDGEQFWVKMNNTQMTLPFEAPQTAHPDVLPMQITFQTLGLCLEYNGGPYGLLQPPYGSDEPARLVVAGSQVGDSNQKAVSSVGATSVSSVIGRVLQTVSDTFDGAMRTAANSKLMDGFVNLLLSPLKDANGQLMEPEDSAFSPLKRDIREQLSDTGISKSLPQNGFFAFNPTPMQEALAAGVNQLRIAP